MAIDGVGLPFQEAINYFDRKVNLPTQKWDDLRHGAHVRAFSVAGVTRDDMLTDFRAAIARRLKDGTSFEDFRKEFDRIVDATGWKFNARGATEEERRAWRARVIYQTNLRTAYMAGRYKQMRDPDVLGYRPYWRYKHNDVRFPRLQHLAWDGMVLSADDPAWDVIYPPNGWGCQCEVIALSRRDLAKMGKTGPDPSPDLRGYQATDPRTGAPETRYPGVDRGWEYNVGKSSLDGLVPVELQAPLPPMPPPAAMAARTEDAAVAPTPAAPSPPPPPPPTPVDPSRILPDDLPDGDYIDAFLAEFGATRERPESFRDAAGGIVTIDAGLFETRNAAGEVVWIKANKQGRGPFVRLIADAIREPDEIWADWTLFGGDVALTRSYLKWFSLPRGRSLFALFRFGRRGWTGTTGYAATATGMGTARRGALLFRRKE